ncbi:MAG: DUF177 domain-containing protein [Prevotellaceae bacterium]|nr:DUF177 domain-containing protein [Prevotellaceae bacterium]
MSKFRIYFKEQTAEEEAYCWEVDDSFFAQMGGELQRGRLSVDMKSRKLTASDFELKFRLRGDVEVECDRCLEPMRQPVDGESELLVRIGERDGDDGETVTTADGEVDLAWNVYEMIALSLPMRHVHPEGECKGAVAEALSRYEGQQETDHRWDTLREIIDNN